MFQRKRDSMAKYIAISILLIVVGYIVYLNIIANKRSKKSQEIYAYYKNILDSKLLPLGFKYQQEYEDVREKEISYKRNDLKIALCSAPPLYFNEIYATSGKKITLEERNNQLPAQIRDKLKFLNEQDKYGLVDATDFKIELLESEEAKEKFLQTLDKWLAENQ